MFESQEFSIRASISIDSTIPERTLSNMPLGWRSSQVCTTEELGKYAWAQGFFQASHYNWDGKTWVRNFHELRTRDLALCARATDVKSRRVLAGGCGGAD